MDIPVDKGVIRRNMGAFILYIEIDRNQPITAMAAKTIAAATFLVVIIALDFVSLFLICSI
jgi:hypothetical protein